MLTSYRFYQNGVLRLQYRNGYRDVQLNENSGKIVWRRKLRGSIQHTGIELGRCKQTREQLYIHNHPSQRKASIVSAAEFGQGNSIHYQNEPCVNTPREVIEKGLSAVIRKTPYQVVGSNCQNLTNGACKNVSYSQDLNKVAGGIAAVGLGFLALAGINAAFKE